MVRAIIRHWPGQRWGDLPISRASRGVRMPRETPETQSMPRYLIEREWPAGFSSAPAEWGEERCREIVDANLEEGVTWIVSYLDRALQRAFCLYESPTPEAIRA